MMNHRISSTIPSIKDMMVSTYDDDDDNNNKINDIHNDDGDSLDDGDYDVVVIIQDR